MLYQLSYQSDYTATRPTGRAENRRRKNKKNKTWSIGVSIPVPRACKARTLPIELMPRGYVTRELNPDAFGTPAPVKSKKGYCLKWGSNPRGQTAQQILSLPP